MEYKDTTWVDLPEVDFSFHEDNPKLTGNDCLGFPTPSLLRPFSADNVDRQQFSIKDASSSRDLNSLISLTFRLPLWKEKSTSDKSTLVVFL